MMQSLLCTCKQRIYEDTETKNRFNDQAASTPHRCQAQPIPLYVREFYHNRQFVKLDFAVPESEHVIASKIVAESLKVGKDPYTVQVVRKGDFLLIR